MRKETQSQLLAIGPLPPPLAGTSVSFELFREHICSQSTHLNLTVINSAPKDVGKRALFSLDNLKTACRVLGNYFWLTRRSDSTIVFGNDQFLLSLMPLCLVTAKLFKKPFYIRCFGGSLDQYYSNLPAPVRRYFRFVLNRCDGLIVQTELLKTFFEQRLSVEVTHVPGYRESVETIDRNLTPTEMANKPLRLVYLGHIREEKGVFDLLDSLKLLDEYERETITCDFYGPIYEEIESSFHRKLALTTNATYHGMLPHENVIPTISTYDVLVFPTYYPGEGHAGVIVEAMMAGMPIITTRFNALPELITHGKNGLLVSPNNPEEIANSIRLLADSPDLRQELGHRALESSRQYSSNYVIPKLVQAINLPF